MRVETGRGTTILKRLISSATRPDSLPLAVFLPRHALLHLAKLTAKRQGPPQYLVPFDQFMQEGSLEMAES